VSSVVRSGVHVIGVVMGGRSAYRRDTEMVHLLDLTFAEINTHPQLVARANIPWQTVAQNSNAQPIIAGFQFAVPSFKPSPPNQQFAASSAAARELDEETAESQTDKDELIQPTVAPPAPKPAAPAFSAPVKPQSSPPAQPASQAVVMLSKPIFTTGPSVPARVPAVTPAPRDDAAAQNALLLSPPQAIPLANPVPRGTGTAQAAVPVTPQTIPLVNPIARSAMAANINSTRPADLKVTTAPGATTAKIAKSVQVPALQTSPLNLQGWTIQIGAFGDVPSARAQLAAYAERSMDVLGQAERIIIPFQGVDGKTMYRARFGPFPEQQARSVCATLTQRGQTCFAATMTAH